MGEAPVVETERLRLRGQQPGDLARHSAMLADPQVMRFVGGQQKVAEGGRVAAFNKRFGGLTLKK